MKVPVSETLAIEVAQKVEVQVQQLAAMTPPEFIKRRKGRGGMMLDYVEANYIVARLNSAFRFNWDFTVVDKIISTKSKSIATLGRLTVRFADGQVVTKEQWGSAEIKTYRESNEAVDVPDDLKASASDALKKCASLLGIAWDVYGGFSKSEMPKEEPKTKKEKEQEQEEPEEEVPEAEVVSDDEWEEEGDPFDQAAHSGDEEERPTMPDPEPKKKEGRKPTPEEYKTINIPWIDGRKYWVSKFEVLELFGKMKKALGEKFYYEILGQGGFEKSDQIPKEQVPTIMKAMVDAYLGT